MANRSYVYATDTRPAADHQPSPVRGICERNWGIPLLHQLLAGRDTRVGPSVIWPEHRIGISADYAGGVELATRFLAVLGAGDTPEHAAVTAAGERIASYLADSAHQGRFLLLEAGEIFDLTGGDLAGQAAELAGDTIPAAVTRAEAAIAGGERDWLAGVLADWPAQIDSYYSPVLYFSFPDA